MERNNSLHIGLFLLRLGIGIMFIYHGFGKMFPADGDYIARWEWIGSRMNLVGITFWPIFWGFMAALAEFGGGILLILGLFTRVSSVFLAFTMLIAMLHHLKAGDGLAGASHALELMIVFIALAIAGAGKLSFDNWWFNSRNKNQEEG